MDQEMFVWPKENMKKSDTSLAIVKLRHPRTRTSSVFLQNQSSDLQEILNFKDGHRSWFLDNHVVSSKVNLHVSTPIDKILLLLPYLEISKNFSPLLDIVVDEDFPSNQSIFDEDMDISCVTDKKCVAGLDVYRLNKSKTIKYLLQKLERVALVLKERQIDVSLGNFSAGCNLNGTVSDSEYKRFAHGILSEYISNDLSQELLTECQLNGQQETSAPSSKRSPEQTECEPDLKRKKTDPSSEPVEDYSKEISTSKTHAKSTAKLTNSQKKLMNSSKKGIKSIQSFFGKPK